MEVQNALFSSHGPRRLVIKRRFLAPVASVFKAFTDPALLAQWWGPQGFTNPVCIWEAKPNGRIYVLSTDAQGTPHPIGGTFHEIDEGQRLLFTTITIGNDALSPTLKMLNAVRFMVHDNHTQIHLIATIQHAEPQAAPVLQGMEATWCQSLDKLEMLLDE